MRKKWREKKKIKMEGKRKDEGIRGINGEK